MIAQPLSPLILVIDDDGFSRRAIRNAIGTLSSRIVEASSGVEGLRMIATEKPDLVLLDIRMPLLGGVEVLRELRSSEQYRHIAIVAMSGKADSALVNELLALGISGFLVKPLYRDDVVQRLRPIIAALQYGEPSGVSPSQQATADRPRLLVASADANFRGFAVPLLERRFKLLEASTGIEAHETILEHRPVFALLSAGLPLLSEARLSGVLKAVGSDTKLVLLTNGTVTAPPEPTLYHAIIKQTFVPEAFISDLTRVGVLRTSDANPLSSFAGGELHEPLVSAVQQTLGVLAARDVTLVTGTVADVSRNVVAAVPVRAEGGRGVLTVQFSCSTATAEALGSEILGETTTLEAGSLDAISEIVSTIGGRLREYLVRSGVACELQFPTVAIANAAATPLANAQTLVFSTAGAHAFVVDLAVSD
jgi:CheY-like chemotaxis protein/CheY-specific phosphatase CheX